MAAELNTKKNKVRILSKEIKCEMKSSINEFVAIFSKNKSQNTENSQNKPDSSQALNRLDECQTILKPYPRNADGNYVANMNAYKKSIKKFIESKPSSKSSYSEQDLFNTKTGKHFFWNSLRFTSTKKVVGGKH